MTMNQNNFQIRENIKLAPLTTFRVGGPARYFIEASNEETVQQALVWAKERGLPLFILGGGSNIIVADGGFKGLVVQIALKGIDEEIQNGRAIITAAAGEDWDAFVAWCVERDFAGFECLSGIPGFVGGTPVQNVGAYGQEVSETIVSVRALDRKSANVVEISNEACGFSYRHSIFNTTERESYVVLSVTYALTPHAGPALRYADVQRYFAGYNAAPTLKEVRNAVCEIRARKSMVISPDDPNSQSAGSFFKNPIISEKEFVEVEERAKSLGVVGPCETVPRYPAGEGQAKIPAAWLIERAGFYKGYVRGPAGLSTNHTLAIINRGGATAKDILVLMREIQTTVEEKFSVQLKPEPVFVGFEE